MLTRWRMPMFLLDVGDEYVREQAGVMAREGPLAARTPHREVVHVHQSRHSVPCGASKDILICHQPGARVVRLRKGSWHDLWRAPPPLVPPLG